MIHCFSGNGNSRRVARSLGEEIANRRDVVVWVFPIHAWTVPQHVLEEIATAECPAEATHWMVATCGDDIGMADRHWRRAIEARGWKACGAWSVAMPNTYICLPGFDVDTPEVAEAKLAAMPERVAAIGRSILAGESVTDVTRGAFARVKSGPLRLAFEKLLMSDRYFRVSDKCNGCGRCAARCPVRNIEMEQGRPRWSGGCTMCLGCLHGCPHRAIDWGAFTRGKKRFKQPINR